MTRTGLAMVTVLVILSLSPAVARGEECGCCRCGAVELGLPAADPTLGPSLRELEALLAGGVALTAASYVFGVITAERAPHSITAVDTIPIVGAVASAVRNANDPHVAPLLVLSAGAQAMGLVILAAAGSELAEKRHLLIDVGAGPDGCHAGVTWRFH